jgi:glyoxylase-like metal-dependent hydrolase (beta-lactamase superfamily II)
MKRQLIGLNVAIFLLLPGIFGGGSLMAQQRSASEKSYMQARKALDAGLDAMGGREALQKVEDVSLKFKGTIYARNQSLTPDAPYSREPVEGWTTLDFKRRWISFESASTLPGFRFSGRQILKDGKGYTVDLTAKAISPATNPNFFNNVTRSRFPHVLLLLAAERAATLRWLGAEDYEGRKHSVVAFATPEGAQLTLYFDAQTNLLSKYETLDTDATAGDVTTETIFPEYKSVGGIKMPTARIIRRGGELTQDVKYTDVQLNTRPADAVFEKPAGFEERPEPPAAPPFVVTELAKEVHLLQDVGNGYNALAVVFNDYVLVVESPLNDATSRRAIAKVREMAPGKPIKYLVVTHHHDDHSGGARTYLGEGATLVTTPGNVSYFERMAAATRTFDPDALSRNPRKPAIEAVQNKKRVFSDDKHTVELYDIGPSPHAREMLVVYLPKEKILFQGDLLILPDTGINPANDTTIHFAEWLNKMGLSVDKIVGVHGRTGTMDDLRRAIEKMRGGN